MNPLPIASHRAQPPITARPTEHAPNYLNTDIVLCDLIRFSLLGNPEQHMLISAFTELFRRSVKVMTKGHALSRYVLATVPTGDGFYTLLHPSQRGFGPMYALALMHVAKRLDSYKFYNGMRVAAHHGSVVRFAGIDGADNYVGSGMNECSRFVEDRTVQDIPGHERGYVMISAPAYQCLEQLLERDETVARGVEALGVGLGEWVGFSDKHGQRYEGVPVYSETDSILTFPNI